MAQNTALQELIEYLNKDFEWVVKNSPDYGVIPQIIKKATELLPKERQQIIDGYKNGFYAGCDQPLMDNMPDNYFTNTFNQ